ncbi:fungal-specific transcription factor domain-containing protein [Phlyctochytrium arcticum]|nr:fungal-specific transcription factor domain-containing protein [Phlyctochytrium arcticum]
MASQQQPDQPKRKRVYQACDQCRKRKYKCDGVRPTCSTCEKSSLKCEWSERRGTLPTTTRPIDNYDASGQVQSAYIQQLHSRLQELEEIARTREPHQDDTGADLSKPRSHHDGAIDDAQVDELVELFFACEYHVLPFNYLHTCTTIRKTRTLPPALLYALCALGAKYTGLFPEKPRQQAGDYFYFKAQQFLTENDNKPELSLIHSLLLLAFYALSSGRVIASISHYDMALSMALAMGLHQYQPETTDDSWFVAETKKRTFWACYIADKQLGLLGFRISRIDISSVCTGSPSPELFWHSIFDEKSSPPADLNRSPMQDPYAAFLPLYHIFDQVHPPRCPGDSPNRIVLPNWIAFEIPPCMVGLETRDTTDLEIQLQNWANDLPPWARNLGQYFNAELTADVPICSWYWVLVRLLYHTSYMVLYWPALLASVLMNKDTEQVTTRRYLDKCRDASFEIISILKNSILPSNPTMKNLEPTIFGICIWQTANAFIAFRRLSLLSDPSEIAYALQICGQCLTNLGAHFEPATEWARDLAALVASG